jgi:hypothetical protein
MSSTRFFQIVEDLAVFEFKSFNLFKLFYVPFVFKESGRPAVSVSLRSPGRGLAWALRRCIGFLTTAFATLYWSLLASWRRRIVFYGASGRHAIIDGVRYDLYNARIVEERGRNHFVILEDHPSSTAKRYQPDLCLHDLAPLIGFLCVVSYIVLGRDIEDYARTVTQRYPELGFTKRETTQRLLLFYGKFLAYRLLLSLLRPERVFLIAHYGKEAFIAACRHKGIEVTELMHGTILSSHPQYNFPKGCGEVFHRSLFPHKLAVYGEYWRQVVSQGNMFPPDATSVVGYYLKVPDIRRTARESERMTILISAQPSVQEELCEYVSFLKSRLNQREWQIVVRPHPMESEEAYGSLQQAGFVTVSHESVYELLAECDVHISVYSSVLYEALRYDVANYVLRLDKVSSHCDAIIDSGVAQALTPSQVPDPSRKPKVTAELYFADYDPSALYG